MEIRHGDVGCIYLCIQFHEFPMDRSVYSVLIFGKYRCSCRWHILLNIDSFYVLTILYGKCVEVPEYNNFYIFFAQSA